MAVKILTNGTRREESQQSRDFALSKVRQDLHHGPAATIVCQQSYPTAVAPKPLRSRWTAEKMRTFAQMQNVMHRILIVR